MLGITNQVQFQMFLCQIEGQGFFVTVRGGTAYREMKMTKV